MSISKIETKMMGTQNLLTIGRIIERTGYFVIRYGLVLLLVWIGAMKFSSFEAAAIKPLVETSPLMSWMYDSLSVRGVSCLLGTVELSIAVMIALRPVSAKLAAVGSFVAVFMFITTLSFILSLPGWEPSLGGFPALSGSGGFLVKDVLLLGAAIWSLGESLVHIN